MNRECSRICCVFRDETISMFLKIVYFGRKKKSYTIIKLNMILQILVNIMYAIRILNKNIGRKLLFLEYYYK